jgi:hypothetical protein
MAGADGLSTLLRVARAPIEAIAQAANPKMKPMDFSTTGTAVSVPGLKSPIEKKDPTKQETHTNRESQATTRNIPFAALRASDLRPVR